MSTFNQLITPNPNIDCRPGWCLEYVRRSYGLAARYPTAIDAWNASASKHRDWNFPAGVWIPLWFTVKGVPAGHVVLRAPDGRIYSTTTPNRYTPTIHPNLADLERVYAAGGVPLTYQGWTEDVAGTRVVAPAPAPAAGGKLLTVTASIARVRTSPEVRPYNIAAAYPDGIAQGAQVAAIGYVSGEDPYPNDGVRDDAWIKTKSGFYIWANNLGNSLAGLNKLN
jgi:hypothetical protein